jgi:hypothetical protein
MAIHGLIAGVFAQTCSALLPPPRAEIEWFRDGRPYARDVPLRATATERVYRRVPGSGARVERSLSCTTSNGVSWLTERVGSATIRLPVPLAVGASSSAGGTTVRRIAAPADATGSALWYTVSSPGIRVYGVQRGAGVIEIRSPAAGGGFSILRAVVRQPVPDPAIAIAAVRAAADSQRVALEQRIEELQQTIAQLGDSIAALRARAPPPYSSPEIVELIAVDANVEHGRYDEALALLLAVRRRLDAWSEEHQTRHLALDTLNARITEVMRRCLAARHERRQRERPLCRLDGGVHE